MPYGKEAKEELVRLVRKTDSVVTSSAKNSPLPVTSPPPPADLPATTSSAHAAIDPSYPLRARLVHSLSCSSRALYEETDARCRRHCRAVEMS